VSFFDEKRKRAEVPHLLVYELLARDLSASAVSLEDLRTVISIARTSYGLYNMLLKGEQSHNIFMNALKLRWGHIYPSDELKPADPSFWRTEFLLRSSTPNSPSWLYRNPEFPMRDIISCIAHMHDERLSDWDKAVGAVFCVDRFHKDLLESGESLDERKKPIYENGFHRFLRYFLSASSPLSPSPLSLPPLYLLLLHLFFVYLPLDCPSTSLE